MDTRVSTFSPVMPALGADIQPFGRQASRGGRDKPGMTVGNPVVRISLSRKGSAAFCATALQPREVHTTSVAWRPQPESPIYESV